MPLFHKLLLVVILSVVAVAGYDLYQSEAGLDTDGPRLRFDPQTRQFTFRRPEVSVRIIYASLMSPGEPAMRVEDKWINMFEEEYSDRLAASGAAVPEAQRAAFVRKMLADLAGDVPEARRRVQGIGAAAEAERARLLDALEDWLADRKVYMTPRHPTTPLKARVAAFEDLVAGLEALEADPAEAARKVRVLPRRVSVERRWQGRWVLSANRPRFLTGREVPDIMVSDKMELLALVQDGYAVAMDEPLPGGAVSPLDGPDTWGKPGRTWRQAFIPALLEEGKYASLPDAERSRHIYLAPFTCSAFCIFYNEVMFEKAGISRPPRTWPEFIEVCEKLKAAGFNPITADQAIYADYWMRWLIFRILGPEAWESTVLGVPADKPPPQRTSSPPWTDDRYREVFAQIRLMRDRGYFDKNFRGSTFPAAQRTFASGQAGMMICGSWLSQELASYKDVQSGGRFRLGCFSFPQWPGGDDRNQRAAHGQVVGMMVCRQGRATAHAVELVKYLLAKDWPDMVYGNDNISCLADADFPPGLKGIAEDFRNAPTIIGRMPEIYARRFNADAIMPLYNKFFMIEKGEAGFLSVQEFLQALADREQRYLSRGGEEGYE